MYNNKNNGCWSKTRTNHWKRTDGWETFKFKQQISDKRDSIVSYQRWEILLKIKLALFRKITLYSDFSNTQISHHCSMPTLLTNVVDVSQKPQGFLHGLKKF